MYVCMCVYICGINANSDYNHGHPLDYSTITEAGARNQQFIETSIVAINYPKGIFLVINGTKGAPFMTIKISLLGSKGFYESDSL